MKINKILILFLFLYGYVFAQSEYAYWYEDTLLGDNYIYQTHLLDNGDTYIVGKRNGVGLMMKFDVNGSLLWSKAYSGKERIDQIVPATGVGTQDILVTSTETGSDADVFVTRLDNLGNVVWSRKYQSTRDRKSFLVAAKMNNEQYYIVGDNAPVGSSSDDVRAMKIDGNGNVLSSSKYSNGTDDQTSSTCIDNNDILYVIAHLASGTDKLMYSVINETRHLNTSYKTSISLGSQGRYPDIELIDDDVLIFGAGTFNVTEGLKPFILRMDKTGNVLWLKKIDVDGATQRDNRSIKVDSDNNIYLFVNDVYMNRYILKLDENGNVLNQKKYNNISLNARTSNLALINGEEYFVLVDYGVSFGEVVAESMSLLSDPIQYQDISTYSLNSSPSNLGYLDTVTGDSVYYSGFSSPVMYSTSSITSTNSGILLALINTDLNNCILSDTSITLIDDTLIFVNHSYTYSNLSMVADSISLAPSSIIYNDNFICTMPEDTMQNQDPCNFEFDIYSTPCDSLLEGEEDLYYCPPCINKLANEDSVVVQIDILGNQYSQPTIDSCMGNIQWTLISSIDSSVLSTGTGDSLIYTFYNPGFYEVIVEIPQECSGVENGCLVKELFFIACCDAEIIEEDEEEEGGAQP